MSHGRDESWWYSQGIALVTLLYLGFALFTVAGPLYKDTDVSICGYFEIVPIYYAFMFCIVTTSGANSTLWNIVHIVRTETEHIRRRHSAAVGLYLRRWTRRIHCVPTMLVGRSSGIRAELDLCRNIIDVHQSDSRLQQTALHCGSFRLLADWDSTVCFILR